MDAQHHQNIWCILYQLILPLSMVSIPSCCHCPTSILQLYFTTKDLTIYFIKKISETSGPDGGIGIFLTSSHNHKKDNHLSKNKKQPELPENQTAWKSDNQGFKEETFIQTGRAGREDTVWCSEGQVVAVRQQWQWGGGGSS